MKVNIILEMAKDGGCSCYMREEFPNFSLFGYGDSVKEAKADLLAAYEELKETFQEEGKTLPVLEFVYHYDMRSFFSYFDFLNTSKIAIRAGINPSLMRKYTAGLATAGEGQYLKLQKAVADISQELFTAAF